MFESFLYYLGKGPGARKDGVETPNKSLTTATASGLIFMRLIKRLKNLWLDMGTTFTKKAFFPFLLYTTIVWNLVRSGQIL